MIKGKLSYLNRIYSKYNFRYSLDSDKLSGSSPPSVFIGRKGYPRVYIGPLVPAMHGDTSIMDTPEQWHDKQATDIIDFRLQLIRGKQSVRINEVDKAEKIREIALSKNPINIDIEFKKKPRGIFFHEDMQPFGPSAVFSKMETNISKYDHRMEKAHYDSDLLAHNAIIQLYNQGIFVSSIQKAFSTGAFGINKNRKLVPTRWSITAVDDTLGKHVLDEIRYYPLINEFRVYEHEAINNKFIVILMPFFWRYETMEAFFPQIIGDKLEIYSDWEDFSGKKEYAAIGGCYYSARLAIAEMLEKEKRQAAAIVLREAYPAYIPLGVWNVREGMRQAMSKESMKFETMSEALAHAATRLRIPMQRWIAESHLLKNMLTQRRLSDFTKLIN